MPFRDLDDGAKLAIVRDLEVDMRRERGNAIFIETLLMFLAVGWTINGGIGKGAVTLALGMINLGYYLWQKRLRDKWIARNEQALNWYRVHSEVDLSPTPLYRWILRKYWPGLILVTFLLGLLLTLRCYGYMN